MIVSCPFLATRIGPSPPPPGLCGFCSPRLDLQCPLQPGPRECLAAVWGPEGWHRYLCPEPGTLCRSAPGFLFSHLLRACSAPLTSLTTQGHNAPPPESRRGPVRGPSGGSRSRTVGWVSLGGSAARPDAEAQNPNLPASRRSLSSPRVSGEPQSEERNRETPAAFPRPEEGGGKPRGLVGSSPRSPPPRASLTTCRDLARGLLSHSSVFPPYPPRPRPCLGESPRPRPPPPRSPPEHHTQGAMRLPVAA